MDPHASLYLQRANLAPTDPRQHQLGPLEHGAFARQWTRDNPFLAVPSLLGAIPAYTGYKTLAQLLGQPVARSKPSLDEMAEGYRGMWLGLRDLFR